MQYGMPGYEQSTGLFVMGVLSFAQNAVPSAGAQYGAPGYEQSTGLFVMGVLSFAWNAVEDPGIAGVFPYRPGFCNGGGRPPCVPGMLRRRSTHW